VAADSGFGGSGGFWRQRRGFLFFFGFRPKTRETERERKEIRGDFLGNSSATGQNRSQKGNGAGL